jgi:hypothetical protein
MIFVVLPSNFSSISADFIITNSNIEQLMKSTQPLAIALSTLVISLEDAIAVPYNLGISSLNLRFDNITTGEKR